MTVHAVSPALFRWGCVDCPREKNGYNGLKQNLTAPTLKNLNSQSEIWYHTVSLTTLIQHCHVVFQIQVQSFKMDLFVKNK